MDSCQPAVTDMESTPASSAISYVRSDSSLVLPPTSSSSSQAQIRMMSGISGPISSRQALMISVASFMRPRRSPPYSSCLLYTSDAADDLLCVDLGGRRIIKKKKKTKNTQLCEKAKTI